MKNKREKILSRTTLLIGIFKVSFIEIGSLNLIH